MKRYFLILLLMIVFAEFSQEHSRRRRRKRGDQKRSRYSMQAFQPWFPEQMTPSRSRRRQAQENPIAPISKPRTRKDLNPIFDRILKISEIADPIVPNMNITKLGVNVQIRWMSGLSSVKRLSDVLYYDEYGPQSKAIEFNCNTKDVRVYMTYQISTFSWFYTHEANGSAYMDTIDVQVRFQFNLETNFTTFDTLKVTDRARIRMDITTPGQDLFVNIVDGFFSTDVDEEILPMIKRQIQFELGYVNVKAVLDRLSPGNN